MKYRIIEKRKGDNIEFIPQYKCFNIFWCVWSQSHQGGGSSNVKYLTLEGALECIQHQINNQRDLDKCKNTIEHPIIIEDGNATLIYNESKKVME